MALHLHAASLVDGTGAEPVAAPTLVVDGDTIHSIGRGKRAANDGIDVDLSGCTLLPGLIDAHAHVGLVFSFTGDPGETSPAEIAARIFRNCALCLKAGFTTIRDMCGVDGGLVRVIEAGDVPGPRVFPSGPAIAQTGGHGHMTGPFCEFDHPLAIPGLVQLIAICDGADAVRHAARVNFRRGATQLKVFISGGVVSRTDRLEDTQLTVDELRAAVAEATARNTYVTGHAHNCDAIRNGLEAGLSCFEHGTLLDERTAAAMAAAGAALDPTLAVCHLMKNDWRAWGLDESILARMSGLESKMSDAVRIADAAGILMGSGSDLLGPEQSRRGLEIVLKSRILGPLKAIRCATLGNARIMREDRRLGSLEAGKLADVIAVRGDPLTEPELFDDPRRVVFVLKGGKIVKDIR